MAYQAVTAKQHSAQRWKRFTNYQFAAQDAVVRIAASEVPRALTELPIAFVPENDGFTLVAVTGVKPGTNLLVKDGHWQGNYVPAEYRGYPFRLLKSEEDKLVLCVEESNVIAPNRDGEDFFDTAGKITPTVERIMQFLNQLAVDTNHTRELCNTLQQLDLICPYPITLNDKEHGESRTVEGLFTVSEKKLNSLSDEDFLQLRRGGALQLALCQLISLQHLNKLIKLLTEAYQRNVQTAKALEGDTLNLDFLNTPNDDFLNFDN